MINPDLLAFLKELKKNNHKEWFNANRSRYSLLRKEFEHFISLVIAEIGQFDKQAAQTSPSASIFRINRDIRFAANKVPYKTNFGAFIAKGGRKGLNGGYYIHAEPGECFLAGGIYMPSGPTLKAIRNEIFENFDEFRSIIDHKDFRNHFKSGLWGDKLSSVPKGFPKDFEGIEFLKYKHYTVIKEESDSVFTKPSFMNEIKEVFSALAPFNAFLCRAVEDVTGM